MRRNTLPILIALCLAIGVAAQAELVKLEVQAVLIGKDLNLKPVPKLTLVLRRINEGEGIEIKTGFDGLAEAELPPGRYQLSTPQPVEFQGNSYSWDLEFSISDAEYKLELSNDNATVSAIAPKPKSRAVDNMAELFNQLQDSVVTVWSEFGHGTGFFVDERGLILTNQHVVGPSEFITVQFDPKRKVRAALLASSPERDIAVLWAHPDAFSQAIVAPVANINIDENEPPVVVGERVFTIGSPLSQRKIMTTGIVSGIEEKVLISDININPGNSGGPLFNSLGEVVGLTTFGEQARAGPGISGIVRIEEAFSLLEEAVQKMADIESPSPEPLLVEPSEAFPLDAIKEAVAQERFKTKLYFFGKAKFEVAILTPPLVYYLREGAALEAIRHKEKRTKKKQKAIKGTMKPLDELRGWAEYVGHYQPVIKIRARPQLRETFWSAFARGLNRGYGRAKLRFRTDFYRMRLMCGEAEVEPIHPGKIAHVISENNQFINAVDATYEGIYVYLPSAISPECGTVQLELYSEKEPNKAHIKVLSPETVQRIWADFEPYREMLAENSLRQ
jgi:S1-C subfamily serine protease